MIGMNTTFKTLIWKNSNEPKRLVGASDTTTTRWATPSAWIGAVITVRRS